MDCIQQHPTQAIVFRDAVPGGSSQSVAKADLHPKKVMLIVWWEVPGGLFLCRSHVASMKMELYPFQNVGRRSLIKMDNIF